MQKTQCVMKGNKPSQSRLVPAVPALPEGEPCQIEQFSNIPLNINFLPPHSYTSYKPGSLNSSAASSRRGSGAVPLEKSR